MTSFCTFQSSTGNWAPRTDVAETEQGYALELDLPGIKREELDIQVANDTVTIKGERKPSANLEAYHRLERPYGSFSRVFMLPEVVNAAGIEAKLSDGVLHLTLPRREESKPKQIQVQVQ
ncbi:MAG TPA: Hsp20/alpha crystallin family protein [Terriglobales bacterium]|jgi:HSP20 family protein|nr:Hsp20/alpha crystallin family protein [Terriglobales bacterium]